MKNNYIVKSVVTGLIVGFIATTVGSILWILAFSDMDVETTIKTAFEENVIGAIVAAGALLNIAAFFLFLKQRKNYEARGVLIATFVIAIFVIYMKFIA